MSKKKVYIISHSHWDREWYMPYEQHHMRLIRLMDDLLELFKTNPDFNSFHLDGQTIILDDYLQVRPEKRQEVQEAIDKGKLKIGPFYILQDDFLISSEANVRNTLIGLEEARQWGKPTMLGYFPDTFGNMGQTPQMMEEAGIKAAAFGRGVKPTGFNNAVINDEKYASQFSEMLWEGPDKSKIFGLLFANWYSNGNEIPTTKEEALAFWSQKLPDAEQYASTNHLLMMNGVDHQPVQKDVTEAIKLANELYPDYEFIHSNFDDYLEAVMNDLPENLSTVEGELTSQETDGWYTLANTSSARIYLKQKNTTVERQLENITEPLATMAYEVTGTYPHDELRYAWKTLMQNHPHDSICGCSVDEVHQEMMTRYQKSEEVGKFLADEALTALTSEINTSSFSSDSKPFVVFNTSGHTKNQVVETTIEWKRQTFAEGVPLELFHQLEEEVKELTDFHVVDENGHVVPAEVIKTEVAFDYDLPTDRFRIPYMAIYVTVRLNLVAMPGMSWTTYALTEGKQEQITTSLVDESTMTLENDLVKAEILENGLINFTDKLRNHTYPSGLIYENVGDIGNEYIFKQPWEDKALYAHDFPTTREVITNSPFVAEILITQTMMIPESAEELLDLEMRAVYEMRQRKANRSDKLVPFEIKTIVRLEKNSGQIKFNTSFDNQMKDHRLRVLFPSGLETSAHFAESIFEVVERPNLVNVATWENPTNPQHQQAFVNVHDEQLGMTVANFGLNEYEVLPQDSTIALTILRAVGELGDWGYFPTPEAQCLGQQSVKFAIGFHGTDDMYQTFIEAKQFQVPMIISETGQHFGKLNPTHQFLAIDSKQYALTAIKRVEHGDDIITRGFNLSNTESCDVRVAINDYNPHEANMIEEFKENGILETTIKPAKIQTLRWVK
ncbi:alpha-mannosidase [Vagococcus carniphilus]|uniref:alpha-mannosidase n=1 Tax=Vagococcus carniphilus TaxID=218144 RepID=UPI00288F1700|nr:alpha-mannosidase [Vagococcus carniphilus]MDT2831643.1 alpha-mannosidase [Vagococcus carniphilus]MDT2840449.1 alpha-mannosidase [Vagococcus carniphilus]MDT2855107.1 alpha-mannosidase [Vagococcus carniphilus]